MIMHPMSAKLIIILVTEVFIVVLFYKVQQVISNSIRLLDRNKNAKFNPVYREKAA
jgi:hypothetical protein